MTIDATPGSTANSYVTMAEVDAYALGNGDFTDWDLLTPIVKEKFILKASLLLAELDWVGGLRAETDALRWPRTGIYNKDSFQVDDDTFPLFLKNATIEYARHLSQKDRFKVENQKVTSEVEVGSVRIKYADSGSAANVGSLSGPVMVLISHYLRGQGVELVR